MSKIDFNNSRYAAFFRSGEGQQVLRDFIDRSEMINVNYNWYKTQFAVNPNVTPTDSSGVASFQITAEKQKTGGMLDMRAPLGKAHPYSKEGLSFYTASIPDFTSDAIYETAMERQYKEEYFAQFGTDAPFIRQWAKTVQDLVDAKDQTMNYMAAQLQSTGKIIYDKGRGIMDNVQTALIPEDNFMTAGEKVWSSPDCKLFTQMAQLEDKWRQKTGYAGAMQWFVPKKMFQETFLTNSEVKQMVAFIRNLNSNSPMIAPENPIIPVELFNQAVVNFTGLSPIQIVQEEEKDKNWGGSTIINGWSENIAVLRPTGYAGLIMHTSLLDQKLADKFGNQYVNQNFAPIDGFSWIHTAEMANGEYKSWFTRLLVSAVPALTEFPEHIIVDTATADV